MAATARQKAQKATPDRARLIAYAQWLEADPARGKLTQAEAWRAFSGGAPAPTLPAPSSVPPPPPPPVREVPRPAPKPAAKPVRPRVPTVAPHAIPPRAAPTVSRYERHRLVEVFTFADPTEYVVRCTFHHQTRRALTFAEAIELLDTWRCGVCRTIS